MWTISSCGIRKWASILIHRKPPTAIAMFPWAKRHTRHCGGCWRTEVEWRRLLWTATPTSCSSIRTDCRRWRLIIRAWFGGSWRSTTRPTRSPCRRSRLTASGIPSARGWPIREWTRKPCSISWVTQTSPWRWTIMPMLILLPRRLRWTGWPHSGDGEYYYSRTTFEQKSLFLLKISCMNILLKYLHDCFSSLPKHSFSVFYSTARTKYNYKKAWICNFKAELIYLL